MHLANRRLVVPAPIVAEVGYLLNARAGAGQRRSFLRSLAAEDFSVEDLTTDDYARMAELVHQYADLPLGTTDAAVVAVAERLQSSELGTLDHRDFSIVRPRHAGTFTLCRDPHTLWIDRFASRGVGCQATLGQGIDLAVPMSRQCARMTARCGAARPTEVRGRLAGDRPSRACC